MHLRRFALVASLALIAGCGDETTGPGGIVTGSFSFNFAGGISGTYTASGSFPTNAAQQATTTWAAGEVVTADGDTYLASAVPASASTHNLVTIFAERITAGSVSISSSCSPNCGDFGFFFGLPNTGSAPPAQTCFLTTGTVTFSTLSTTRAVGTFSGSGDCVSAGGATTAFTVTAGTFDVPLVTGVV